MATNTFWSLGAEVIRLASSLATFLILTHLFPPDEFGILIAASSLFGFAFPQASMGAGWLVLKKITDGTSTVEDALAGATGMLLAGGAVVGSALLALRPVLMPQVSAQLFVLLCLSELFLLGMVEINLFAAQAIERLDIKAAVWATYGIGRLAAASLLYLAIDEPNLVAWVALSTLVSLVVLALAQYLTVGRILRPRAPTLRDARDGLPLSVGFGADRLRDVADTVMLVNLGFEVEAGLYSAARRFVNVSQTPIIAFQHASNARMFAAGARSVATSRRLAKRLSIVSAAYGVVAAGVLFSAGGLVALILSDSYDEVGTVLRWMALIPFLLALETYPAMALTASGLHGRRVVLNLSTTLLNIVLNLMWIPTRGLQGAVMATVFTSLVYIVLLWTVLGWSARKETASS